MDYADKLTPEPVVHFFAAAYIIPPPLTQNPEPGHQPHRRGFRDAVSCMPDIDNNRFTGSGSRAMSDKTSDRKVAIVTGAATGIGRAIGKALDRDGYKVAAVGRRRERLEETERDGFRAYVCDIGEVEQVEDAVSRIASDLGRIDVLINNAGIIHVGMLEEMEVSSIDRPAADQPCRAHLHDEGVRPGLARKRGVDRQHQFGTGQQAGPGPRGLCGDQRGGGGILARHGRRTLRLGRSG